MEIDLELSDEEYVVGRARDLLEASPTAAKAWMVTAKNLYPNNFPIQFEAYLIEKNSGHILEAARCFSQIITKFPQNPELWKEIEKVTLALRMESDECDNEKKFLCEMFRHLSSDVQHKLLLFTAEHCEDTVEHCRLLLLLLQRFPTAISSNGPRLVDTLMSAEKHSPEGKFPVNIYRRLLVCELLPLLAKEHINVELPSKLFYKLLHKAIEFYMCYVGFGTVSLPESEPKLEDPWSKLFSVLQFIGHHLHWEPYLIEFDKNWSKEGYWQNILKFCQTKSKTYPLEEKQLLVCSSTYFLYCLYHYKNSMNPDSRPGDTSKYLLVEAFTDPNLPYTAADPKGKKRKGDGETGHSASPFLTIDKQEMKYIQCNFICCVNCWDLLNSADNLKREFAKFFSHVNLDQILSDFVVDYALYKGLYEEALLFLQKVTDPALMLQKYLRLASILYTKSKYTSCFELILLALPLLLPSNEIGALCENLIVGGNQRHLHYLPLTRMNILQYLVKILIRCIKENMTKHSYSELAIGHIFVLCQLDWPQEEDSIPPLLELIKQHRSYKYYNFQNYIVNVELLEEITYLGTIQGGQIQLDLLPHLGQRRIGTRGADKGVKEEIKQTIRRQIAKSNEKFDDLIINFILNERSQILQTLV